MGELNDTEGAQTPPHPFDDVEEAEARAIMDSLALAVYADKEFNADEVSVLDELVADMELVWGDGLLSEGYVAIALQKAKTIIEEDGLREAAVAIADTLHDGRYPYLFEMMAKLVVADREITYGETDFINTFAELFGIDPAVAAEIVEFAEDQLD